jgi:MoaA/NifB/PqqE/SkfB family radical SAM enzyme
VFWLGFTGGEPLLNKDIVKITEYVGDGCSIKLFTTGCTLTKQLAMDLKKAGLLYVSVSLDHWKEEEHDRVRRYQGAFQTALTAIKILQDVGDLHVSVSAVLPKDMIRFEQVEEFMQFLINLGIHEAWLSEAKPSVATFWRDELVITEQERKLLCDIQDEYNKQGNITVNYLGHFEGKEHFGCNAGHKMVYIDSFGEVSPCVFTPMTFGNIKERSVEEIFIEMKHHFPSGNTCFINKDYKLMQKFGAQNGPICYENSIKLMQEVRFGPLSRFFYSYYH